MTTPPAARILIFGTGGVGSIYTYLLQNGGAEVTTVCRTNYDAVKEHGISIFSPIFGNVHFNPTHVVRYVSEAAQLLHPSQHYDFVLVASKAFPGTSEKIKDAVTPDQTAIVLAQNGILIEKEYKELYPTNPIISGVVYLPTTQVSPGIIDMGPLERFEIGLYPSPPKKSSTGLTSAEMNGGTTSFAQQRIQQFHSLFTSGGGTCTIEPDIQVQRWIKLSVNASWNPICALTRLDDANFLRSSGEPLSSSTCSDSSSHSNSNSNPTAAEDAVLSIFHEVSLIASAAGYPVITDDVIAHHMARPRGRLETGGKEPSMLTDVRYGRPIEVEAILGNTVRKAQELGVRCERLAFLYALAKGLDYGLCPDERWRPILEQKQTR